MDVGNIKRCGNVAVALSALRAGFALLLGPVGAVIAILSLVGVALVQLYKHNETFRNAVNNAWESIKSGTVAAVEAMKSAIDSFRFLSWDNTGKIFSNGYSNRYSIRDRVN